MQFNADIDRMRAFCVFRHPHNSDNSCHSGVLTSARIDFYCRLKYYFEKLIDRDFPDFEAFSEQMMQTIALICEEECQKAQNRVSCILLEREKPVVEDYFWKRSEQLDLPVPPYHRVICGEEKRELCDRIWKTLRYSGGYWYPLDNSGVARDDCLYVCTELVAPLGDQIMKIVGSERFYQCEEFSLYEPYEPDCFPLAETGSMYIGSTGIELAYIAKDFSWIIYLSHEDTVTFAGRILEPVKELLADQKDRWNRVAWE